MLHFTKSRTFYQQYKRHSVIKWLQTDTLIARSAVAMLQSCQTGLWGCEICFRWWPWFTGINLRCGFALPLYNTALFGGPCYVLVPDIGFSFMLFLCQYYLYYSFIHTFIYLLSFRHILRKRAYTYTRTHAYTHTVWSLLIQHFTKFILVYIIHVHTSPV